MLKAIFKTTVFSFLMIALLTACQAPRDDLEPSFDNPTTKPLLRDDQEVMGRDNQEPIFSVPLSKNIFVPQPLEPSDPLPHVRVKNFSVVDATILETFRLLVLDEGIAVTADPAFVDTRITVFDLSGSLKDVMDRISETYGVYYSYKNGLLRITPTRTFIVPLPPLTDAFEGIAGVVSAFGAVNVNVDRSSRLLVFEANRRAYDNIRSYLDQVKENKVLIVYDTYVIEVQLNDIAEAGINWNNFNLIVEAANRGNPSYAFTGSGGSTVSSQLQTFVFGAARRNSNDFTVSTMLQFLRTQGNVEIISKPTLTLISGTSATFEVGRETTYVSEVETTFQFSGNEDRPVTSVTPKVVVTGLRMELTADYVDQSIFSQVKLEIADLVGLPTQEFSTGFTRGTDDVPLTNSVTLPITTTRNLATTMRARPGDTILMAGINQTRDDASYQSLPLISSKNFSTGKETQVVRSEIVIVMTPRVIRFDSPVEKTEVVKDPGSPVTPSSLNEGARGSGTPLDEENYQGLPLPRPNADGDFVIEPTHLLQQGQQPLPLLEEPALRGGRTQPLEPLLDELPPPAAPPPVHSPSAAPAPSAAPGEDPFSGKVQYFHKDGNVTSGN